MDLLEEICDSFIGGFTETIDQLQYRPVHSAGNSYINTIKRKSHKIAKAEKKIKKCKNKIKKREMEILLYRYGITDFSHL